MIKRTICLCLMMVLALSVAGIAQTAASGVSLVRQAEGWQFFEDGQPVMFYRTKARSLNGKYARADYIHPLMGLDGQVLTEDFPEDHLHHRGIFWTWHQLLVKDQPMGDAWMCQDFVWDVKAVRALEQGSEAAALAATVLWKSPLWKNGQEALVLETVTIKLHRRKNDCRMIDFTISLLALQDDTWLGGSVDDKGYGGFTARIATPENAVFASAIGPVAPKNTPVFGGPWMNVIGTLEGKPYGTAILQHPENPLFPQAWILRNDKRYSNMQNPVYPWRYPVTLPTDEPTVLRYRLLVHQGLDVAAAWKAYR
ncbi:MAG: PmoA family protein [Phycisphaerae bacterium]|nr:PmoA family protein [Phycisphaerae bacterium]